jgi:DNA transformation protein
MDRDFLLDLFAGFGAVTLRRMFSGYGVSRDGINFALVLRGAIYLRADERTIPRFETEGAKPFQYTARGKTVTLGSYWQLPELLYDDVDELAGWARDAFEAARQVQAVKNVKKLGKSKARGKKAAKVAAPRIRAKRQAT